MLRYGCAVEEDPTEYLVYDFWQTQHAFAVDCWRWLAFGLFYPRPKRFARAFKLRSLGNLICNPLAIRTIARTLRNPAAQLIYNDLDGRDTSMAESLMVCTVKSHAKIEVFVSGLGFEQSHASSWRPLETAIKPRIASVDASCAFEALCEREDGAMCVVVPGAGLGWVQKEFVERVEHEPLDVARNALDGLYHATIGIGANTDHIDELRPLFEAIGHQLRSLSFDFFLTGDDGTSAFRPQQAFSEPVTGDSVVQIICAHCTHLERLKLNSPSAKDVSDHFTALKHTNLRHRLRVLDLNDSASNARKRGSVTNGGYLGDNAAACLATVLADGSATPALEDLRLRCSMSSEALERLRDALRVNHTVTRIELSRSGTTFPDPHLKDAEDRLDAELQGQVLRHCSPWAVKGAFLSAMAAKYAPRGDDAPHARHSIDQDALALILAFAAAQEIRREVVWADHRSWCAFAEAY